LVSSGDPISAKIESISTLGLMIIRFNQSMDIERFTKLNGSLKWINESMIDIYVVPSEERLKHTEVVDVKKLNMTWEAIKFENKHIHIQVNFTNPLFISPHEQ